MKKILTTLKAPLESLNRFRESIEKATKQLKQFGETMPCPDCKDGFYYPLSGPREPCQTCNNIETATKNLHNALADQVFLRQAEGRYARTPVSEVNVEVTPPNDAELIRLLARKKQYMAAYIKGKNEIFSELYGGKPARNITPLELVEKGLTVKEAQEVARKLHRYTTQVNLEAEGRMNRGGIVPKGVAFDVETSGQVNIEPSLSRIPMKPLVYAKQIKQALQRNPTMTLLTLAQQVSKSVPYLQRYLDLLKLDFATQILVDSGRITMQDALTERDACEPKERTITDWAKYLPDYLKYRVDLASQIFLKDEADHQGDIVKTVVTAFFKMSTSRIEKAFLVRSSVTVAQLAVAVTEVTTKRQEEREAYKEEYLSRKALKENGFSPTL